jgi:hypothetical protein
MEMTVDVGEGVTAPQEPGNPALDAARAEMTEIATNPTHPKHAGYRSGDPAVSAYLQALYQKAVPTTPSAPAPQHDADQGTTPEDRVAQAEVEERLRQSFGDSYDGEMANMRTASQHLFATTEGQQALAALAPILTNLGPLAEVRAIRFLAELGDMIQTHKGA